MLEYRYAVSKMSAAEFAGYMKKIYAEGPVAVYTNIKANGSRSTLNVYRAGYVNQTGIDINSAFDTGTAMTYTGTRVWVTDVFGHLGLGMYCYVDHMQQYSNGSGSRQDVYGSNVTGSLSVGSLSAPSLSISGNVAIGDSIYRVYHYGVQVDSLYPQLRFNTTTLGTSFVF